MKDYKKTKAQLIDELNALRQQVAELKSKTDIVEKKAESISKKWIARSPRVELYVDIEFTGDFDTVQAKGINLSVVGFQPTGDRNPSPRVANWFYDGSVIWPRIFPLHRFKHRISLYLMIICSDHAFFACNIRGC